MLEILGELGDICNYSSKGHIEMAKVAIIFIYI